MIEQATPASPGLPPRPVVDPAVVAVLVAAAEQTWPRAVAFADDTDPAHAVWRFSGRWWNKPTPVRRERPWGRR